MLSIDSHLNINGCMLILMGDKNSCMLLRVLHHPFVAIVYLNNYRSSILI